MLNVKGGANLRNSSTHREMLSGDGKDRQVNHQEMIAQDCARARVTWPAQRTFIRHDLINDQHPDWGPTCLGCHKTAKQWQILGPNLTKSEL